MLKFESRGHKYVVEKYPAYGILIIERDGVKKYIRVVPDTEYVYKIQKTQIRAMGGVTGLYDFMEETLREQFMDACTWLICRKAFEEVKPCKVR